MARIRVLIAEDSRTVRAHLVETLSADDGIEIVGECGDGQAAVELCARLRPDVVTLDMMMPRMTGLEAVERIMAFHPTPILIISASSERGELLKSLDALAAGAIDALEKPGGTIPVGPDWDARLVARVKLVSRIRPITHPRARLTSQLPAPAPQPRAAEPVPRAPRLVAIGASTGGPIAVEALLGALPRDFPLPILVVIHIGKPFGLALAEWLGRRCPLPLREAAHGEPLPARGCVLLAPPDRHLRVERGTVLLDDGPERHFCRPSVDVLFESAARECGSSSLAVLLTGMGRDGAAGMLALRQAGGGTIAQDEASSVVWGMPGEAVRLGAARRVLPLEAIAPALAAMAVEGAA
jgi:two-component system chemotaxis response regulator CheB